MNNLPPQSLHNIKLESISVDITCSNFSLRSNSISLLDVPLEELEEYLQSRWSAGELAGQKIVFGSLTDPLSPFHLRFDQAMHALKLFSSYKPQQLKICTASPLIVIALPLLRNMSSIVSVEIEMSTLDDKVRDRSYPDLPKPSEQLTAARSLQEAGIRTLIKLTKAEEDAALNTSKSAYPHEAWDEGYEEIALRH